MQIQPSNVQQIISVVSADGTAANVATGPTTAFAYSMSGNIMTIYGVPQDGLGGYQDIWLVTQVVASNGSITTTASIAGSVAVVNGKSVVKALGNTSSDTSQGDIISGATGTLPGALLVNDVPDHGVTINPF